MPACCRVLKSDMRSTRPAKSLCRPRGPVRRFPLPGGSRCQARGVSDDPSQRAKATLHEYLRTARDAVVWKLDGLSEYDIRRPVTPTGTNLLGLVKHLTIVEAWFFGATFERPFPEVLPSLDDEAEPDSDLWVTPDESRADVVTRYERARRHADATIDELDLGAVGRVPGWPHRTSRCRPCSFTCSPRRAGMPGTPTSSGSIWTAPSGPPHRRRSSPTAARRSGSGTEPVSSRPPETSRGAGDGRPGACGARGLGAGGLPGRRRWGVGTHDPGHSVAVDEHAVER